MVRGVNKSIIEVNDTGNKYFERVLFFVNPDYAAMPHGRLENRAAEYIKNIPLAEAVKCKRPKRKRKNRVILAAALGTFLAAAVSLVLILI